MSKSSFLSFALTQKGTAVGQVKKEGRELVNDKRTMTMNQAAVTNRIIEQKAPDSQSVPTLYRQRSLTLNTTMCICA
jgi:hypothetical protein